MATTTEQIRGWLKRSEGMGMAFMLVVCDTFDYEDYPVYCTAKNVRAEYKKHHGVGMQKVMEVYDLNKNWDAQLNEYRAMSLPSEESGG